MAELDLDLVYDDDIDCALTEDELFEAAEIVLDEEGVERPCGVSLSIVADEHMHALNHEWRGIDSCTDVLSLECERPDDPDLAPGEPCELGDIVLAPAYIAPKDTGINSSHSRKNSSTSFRKPPNVLPLPRDRIFLKASIRINTASPSTQMKNSSTMIPKTEGVPVRPSASICA